MPINLLCDLKNPPIGKLPQNFKHFQKKMQKINFTIPAMKSVMKIAGRLMKFLSILGALVVVELIKSTDSVSVEWNSKETSIKFANNTLSCVTNNDLLRALAREASSYQLHGKTPIERTQIDHWLTYCLNYDADIDAAIQYLNKCLAPLTYLVSNKLTIADLAVFNEFFAKYEDLKKTGLPSNVQRWYDLVSSLPAVQATLKSLPKDAKLKRVQGQQRESTPTANIGDRKQEGKFVDLPGAEMGKVVVRFPPEASGYLHIGHAKAALLNQYYQQAFQGKLIMRL
jgi:bifunctional glutamyl/prolyl-tRNA synthetase